GGCDTCFALLFLKRTNLAADLTRKMRKDFKIIEEGIVETPKEGTPGPNSKSGPGPDRKQSAAPVPPRRLRWAGAEPPGALAPPAAELRAGRPLARVTDRRL